VTRPATTGRFDFADIVRGHRAQLESKLSRAQKRVLTDIAQCRTAALGGHLDQCDACGYEHPSYNSCRNRHCPKCQALAQEVWIEKRRERLLDARHFHVVFTLPQELRRLARFFPRIVFDALFFAAQRTLLELGQRRLSATLGATLVLHTWTRDLRFHPHVHAIVTGGGLSLDGQRWCHARRRFLFPVRVIGRVFRAKMMAELSKAHARKQFAAYEPFEDPRAFPLLMHSVSKLPWNVYAKASFRKAEHVVRYLGRYTHRVGLAQSRLLEVTPSSVTLRTRGTEAVTLTPVELLRRFVQHVLPDGFHKIRHVGLYGAAAKRAKAASVIGTPEVPPAPRPTWSERLRTLGLDVLRCPRCTAPLRTATLPRARAPPPLMP
jgi:Putative transposase/Transposase zinc-binding domain